MKLSVKVLAEGVETRDELIFLRKQGINLFQGYYFAKPAFETLVSVPEHLFDLDVEQAVTERDLV